MASICRSLLVFALAGVSLFACRPDKALARWTLSQFPIDGQGPQGGVIVTSSGGRSTIRELRAPSSGYSLQAGEVIGFEVEDIPSSRQMRIRRQVVASESDFVVTMTVDEAVVQGGIFPGGELRLASVLSTRIVPDRARLLELRAAGDVQLSLGSWGDLAVLRDSSGTRVYARGRPPRVYDARSELRVEGDSMSLRLPDGRVVRLELPEPREPGSQFTHVRERDVYRFQGPRGQPSAELPASGFELLDGSQGLLLSGSFPNGVPGALEEPFRALLPKRNAHLIVLRGLGG